MPTDESAVPPISRLFPLAEVVRCYLNSAAQEMRRTLVRTAFNPVIYEVLDFGISVYDERLELIAEAPTLASFLGANDYAIRKGIDYVGLDQLEPGDIVLMNYPYWSSAHVLDVTLFAPVYGVDDSEKPFAFTCIRAHWMDLGAKDPGYVLDSTDMHQEGLILPGTKIHRRGRPCPEIYELIRFNSRMPDLVIGDLEAQIAATRTGERRLQEIHEKFGPEELRRSVDTMLHQGERIAKKAIGTLPFGTYEAEDLLDDDGVSDDPIPMRVAVTIEPDRFIVDFSDSPAQVPGPVNLPYGRTVSMCRIAFKSLTSPHATSNAGHFKPLEVIAPPGSLFHAIYPAATFTLWTAIVGLELIFKALSTGMPERVHASSGGDVPGFMMVGRHPETERLYAVSNNEPIGWGAGERVDGLNCTSNLSQSLVRNTPVEVLETKTAMRIERLELRCDSGGAGQKRGGAGLTRDIRFLSEGELLTVMKKSKTKPWSLERGLEPEANGAILSPGTPEEKRVGTNRESVSSGDRARILTAGGGGYGPPETRDCQAVLNDVLDGYVSRHAAAEVYKVVVENGEVDEKKTRALRKNLEG